MIKNTLYIYMLGRSFFRFQVVKRDGELDGFKMGKITAAIDKGIRCEGARITARI